MARTNIQHVCGCLWITLPDAINMDNYEAVAPRLETMLAEKPSNVVLDMKATKNIYSAGFGLMVRMKRQVVENGGKLYLVNVSPKMVEGLQTVGLTKILPIYQIGDPLDFLEGHPTAEEALKQ